MAADIHILPGVERTDLGPEVPARSVLQDAIDSGVHPVLVIGYCGGGFYVASSSPDLDKNLGMASKAIIFMNQCVTEEVSLANPKEPV